MENIWARGRKKRRGALKKGLAEKEKNGAVCRGGGCCLRMQAVVDFAKCFRNVSSSSGESVPECWPLPGSRDAGWTIDGK